MSYESDTQALSKVSPTTSPVAQVSQVGDSAEQRALEDAEKTRIATYTILARLFRAAPDDELLLSLAGCDDDLTTGSQLATAWNDLAAACRRADPAALDREFHALFIGLGRGEVLPYASWYLSGFLLDKPLAKLRSDLNELGIERAENVPESEDHVAAICETMALLVDAEAGIDIAGQKKFFDQHLQPWISRFFADVKAARNADFYCRVADLGQRFFEFEESWLSLPQ